MSAEDQEKLLQKAYRKIYKTAEMKTVTDAAQEACEELGILVEHLVNRPLESFASNGKDEQKDLIKVRFEHF